MCWLIGILSAAIPDPAVHQLRRHGQRHPSLQADLGYADRRAASSSTKTTGPYSAAWDGGALFQTLYIEAYLRSVWYALCTALLCLLIGYPFAYFIARSPAQRAPGPADDGDAAVLDIVFVARVRLERHPGGPGRAEPAC
jgi:hypothetical protein